MSYSSIAYDLIFTQKSWETYPYTSKIGGAGDLHFFKKPGDWNFYDGEIPKDFVKLNIRNQLEASYPNESPNMSTIGYAVRKILGECAVKNYISAEDRGWEISDYWATLEAIFISKKDYKGILAKINSNASETLNGNKRNLKNECTVSHPLKKQKRDTTPLSHSIVLKPTTHEIVKQETTSYPP